MKNVERSSIARGTGNDTQRRQGRTGVVAQVFRWLPAPVLQVAPALSNFVAERELKDGLAWPSVKRPYPRQDRRMTTGKGSKGRCLPRCDEWKGMGRFGPARSALSKVLPVGWGFSWAFFSR